MIKTLAVIVIGVAVYMVYLRFDYLGRVEAYAEHCNERAAQETGLGLAPSQIDCTLVHHDILIRFRVSADAPHEFECAAGDLLQTVPEDVECSFLQPGG